MLPTNGFFFRLYRFLYLSTLSFIFFTRKNSTYPSTQQQPTIAVSVSPVQTEASEQPAISSSPAPSGEQTAGSPDQMIATAIDSETNMIAAGDLRLSQNDSDAAEDNAYPGDDEVDEGSSKTESLPDGSIEYEYPSDNPNRPHMQIFDNNIVIFRRNIMSNTGYTVNDYADLLTNPEYTSQGSVTYGTNAVVYASPTKGIAIVADTQTGEVYEQDLFVAMSVNDYVKKFGTDISTFNPAP